MWEDEDGIHWKCDICHLEINKPWYNDNKEVVRNNMRQAKHQHTRSKIHATKIKELRTFKLNVLNDDISALKEYLANYIDERIQQVLNPTKKDCEPQEENVLVSIIQSNTQESLDAKIKHIEEMDTDDFNEDEMTEIQQVYQSLLRKKNSLIID